MTKKKPESKTDKTSPEIVSDDDNEEGGNGATEGASSRAARESQIDTRPGLDSRKESSTAKDESKSSKDESSSKDDSKPAASDKKPFWTWERSIEILKVAATIWAALLGSFVTMQYNQRQNELNRIQAIAQMLPHISSSDHIKATSSGIKITSGGAPSSALNPEDEDMSRDGAFWAIFRTANDRNMLRDLAALFPLDIYRVVSSIAVAGELDHDSDALIALQVASEKLATRYSNDPTHTELAGRLYEQALRLRERKPDDASPLRVIDLTAEVQSSGEPTGDQTAKLVKSINDLADAHQSDIRGTANATKIKKSGSFDVKALYKRAVLLGKANPDKQVMQQVAHADLALADIYIREKSSSEAFRYLKHEIELEGKITNKSMAAELTAVDRDGDGFASLDEVDTGLKQAQVRLAKIFVEYPDRGAAVVQKNGV